jgi:hypothetical protein
MDDPQEVTDPVANAFWAVPQTAKQRTAVQNAVSRLFEALAPEQTPARAEKSVSAGLQRHRSPRGCILQASGSAVSVSWFPETGTDIASGELQVVAWNGVVSRPGSATRLVGATVTSELVLNPVEPVPGHWAWRAPDGTVYDTAALVEYCVGLIGSPAA